MEQYVERTIRNARFLTHGDNHTSSDSEREEYLHIRSDRPWWKRHEESDYNQQKIKMKTDDLVRVIRFHIICSVQARKRSQIMHKAAPSQTEEFVVQMHMQSLLPESID